ncbi:MAG: DUF3108 domain-containing protein, partial [Gammaproteobacteria bacterium]
MPNRSRLPTWVGLGLACTALVLEANPVPQPTGFELTYKIKAYGFAVGEMQISLTETDDADIYIYENLTRALGLAKAFRSGVMSETSRFRVTPAGLVPIQYDLNDSTENPDDDTHIAFDWTAGIADSLYEGERRDIEIEPGTLDRMSADLAVILDLQAGNGPERYQMVHRNALRVYEFEYLGEEDIKTPAGKFSTVKYRRQRPGSKRSGIIWFSPALCYHVVQVES